MTHRERFALALEHKEADRVPIDLGSTWASSIQKNAYVEVLKYLGMDLPEPPIWHFMQQLSAIHEEFLKRFEIDVRGIHPDLATAGPEKTIQVKDTGDYWAYSDEWGLGWRMPKTGGFYYDMYQHPLVGADIEQVRRYPLPDGGDPSRWAGLPEEGRRLASEGFGTVLYTRVGAGLLETLLWLQGFEDGFVNLVANPELTECLLDRILDLNIRFYSKMLADVGDSPQVVAFGEDLGLQDRPMLSLEMFRRYLLPRYQALFTAIKAASPNIKILFHTCGASAGFLPDLIEAGVDVLNPVQVSAAGMDTKKLKKEFGGQLVFWGGIDTQHVLPRGTPADVRDEVRRRIDDLAPGGGFVLAAVHNIQSGVPPRNVVTMLETALEYGGY